MCHIWTKIGLKFGNILFHYRVIASGIKQKVMKHTALKVPVWSPTTVLIEPNDGMNCLFFFPTIGIVAERQ